MLNAEGISARSQMARFEAGDVKVADLPLLEMRWDWGQAGAGALDRLGAITGHAEQADLTDRLAATARSTSRWDPTSGVDPVAQEREFRDLVVIRPEGAVLPENLGFLDGGLQNTQWVNGCRRLDALGRAGCVIVVSELTEINAGPEAILFWRESDGTLGSSYLPARDETRLSLRPFGDMDLNPAYADAVFEALHAGNFTVAPPRAKSLQIGETDFLLLP